jgi:hypothetical protein
MKNRISLRLINHQNELRKRAIKEKDEKLRSDYWWLYFDAKGIEPEIREMVLKAEKHTLLEMIIEEGLAHRLLEREKNKLPQEDEPQPSNDEQPQVSDDEPPDYTDDIPPRQKGLWDDIESE